jgi:ATP-dependent DNA helicase RecG
MQKIVDFIKDNPQITLSELADKLNITRNGIDKNIKKLKEQGILRRVGPDKGGHWEILRES